ncbi:MAG: hypothetical protein ACRDTE_29115, partial [Pseudonocardiaceae bacterium]
AVATTSTAATASATSAQEVCQVRVENPHFSSGANGVIYKSRVQCAETRQVVVGPALYVCPVDPQGPEGTWPGQGCEGKAVDVESRTVQPGTVETFYLPRLGQPGARGSGLWVGNTAVSTVEEGPGGTESFRTRAVRIDAS